MKLKHNWKEIGLWTLGKRWRFHVTGHSMLPTLREGEDVLVTPIPRTDKIFPGEIIICRHPSKPRVRMIKRVSEAFYDGSCYVLSDNASEGSDSRAFGVIGRELILGRVTSRLI
ncbi:MAG: nickel-type superoxide dismutase maturation protease [Cyanobacteria bacterium J06560_2]